MGIAINKQILDGAEIFRGYGESDNLTTLRLQPVQADSLQLGKNNEKYGAFYFDVKKARDKGNKAFIVVKKDQLHYHYILDFSLTSLIEKAPILEKIHWSQISVGSLKDDYLFGIDLSDPSGNPLPDSLFIHYINSAIDYLQNLLDIRIAEGDVESEKHDYFRSDYANWGFIQLSFKPVKKVKGLRLMYGDRPALTVPEDWIQLSKLTGQVTLFPVAGSASSLIIGQNGGLFLGFQGTWDYAPQLWEVDYEVGIDEKDGSMPIALLKEAIYKRASCGVLNVWGDLIIGAGIASSSVSIDGASQSIGTTQSAMFGGGR